MDDIAMDNELSAWDDRQPVHEKQDPIWTLLAYRLARFALDLCNRDLRQLDRRISAGLRDQLRRAMGSISANIGEAHSRPTARERGRYYSYALGSVREAISWYSTVGPQLPDGIEQARVAVLVRLRKLLLGLIRKGTQSRWRQAG